MPQRSFTLSLALLTPALLLLALSTATSAAQPDGPHTVPANTLTRQRDAAADITVVAQNWGWQR